MKHIQLIETLINLGYSFFVSSNDKNVVVELSLNASSYKDGDEIVTPRGLPKLPHKVIVRRDEDYDELFYIVFIWSFEIIEWPADSPCQ